MIQTMVKPDGQRASASASPSLVDLQQRAARDLRECGCAMGGVFFIAATISWAAYVLIDGRFGLWDLAVHGLRGVAFVAVFSLLGKALGIAIARVRYLALRSRVRRLYGIDLRQLLARSVK